MKKISIYNNFIKDNPTNRDELSAKLKRNGFDTGKGGDFLAVIGGDGTFLTAIQKNMKENPIYIGFNTGNLGFLSEFGFNQVDQVIDIMKRNDYWIQTLPIYQVKIKEHDREYIEYFVNDVVVERKSPHIIHTSVHLNNKKFCLISGDGIVISSSLGSTGYNLSTHGAISLDCDDLLQMTPISPVQSRAYHSLMNPVLLKDKNEITIFPNYKKIRPFRIVCDGKEIKGKQIRFIEIRRSPYSVRILRSKHFNVMQNIRHKILEEE
jgi:NAD+ kinase